MKMFFCILLSVSSLVSAENFKNMIGIYDGAIYNRILNQKFSLSFNFSGDFNRHYQKEADTDFRGYQGSIKSFVLHNIYKSNCWGLNIFYGLHFYGLIYQQVHGDYAHYEIKTGPAAGVEPFFQKGRFRIFTRYSVIFSYNYSWNSLSRRYYTEDLYFTMYNPNSLFQTNIGLGFLL